MTTENPNDNPDTSANHGRRGGAEGFRPPMLRTRQNKGAAVGE